MQDNISFKEEGDNVIATGSDNIEVIAPSVLEATDSVVEQIETNDRETQ